LDADQITEKLQFGWCSAASNQTAGGSKFDADSYPCSGRHILSQHRLVGDDEAARERMGRV